ncbi:MAG: translation initiation factor IF-2 [Gemmataceae bacterium]|nr:translation initiation factor IF-2 [Gemmataceae bacterium]
MKFSRPWPFWGAKFQDMIQETVLQMGKVRIYTLAKELNVDCKELIDFCNRHGFVVKTQLSNLETEQAEIVIAMIKKGGLHSQAPTGTGALAAPPTASIPALVPHRPPQLGPKQLSKKEAAPPPPTAATAATLASKLPVPEPEEETQAAELVPTEPPAPGIDPSPGTISTPPAMVPTTAPTVLRPRMRNLNAAPRPGAGEPGLRRPGGIRPPSRPSSVHLAQPPQLRPRPVADKPPLAPTGPRKLADLPKDLLSKGGIPMRIEDLKRQTLLKNQLGGLTQPGFPPAVEIEDDDDPDGQKGKRPGGVAGRADRHKERSEKQARKKQDEPTFLGHNLTGLLDQEDRGSQQARERRHRHKVQHGPQPRKGKIQLETPITVRSLSEAVGIKSSELLLKLMGAGLASKLNINSVIEPDFAATIALEAGSELEIKKKADIEENLLAGLAVEDQESDLVHRAPIVTVMGHVDHGKTSLLDKIRKSDVVSTETGGITQVLRAWRVDHNGKAITFLDTPGHEAFTKMRARGANVTDIAIIVVAADDGLMPQTEEAINHAKAAGVKIIVAINKVDLPSANIRKTEQQLYGQGLIPDTMGGEVQFVQTSAVSGKGINELLETISLVAEVEDFRANPAKPAKGVCLEGNVSEGEGIFATVLVQEGTLRRGDVILCGTGYGRVRSMYDDLGRPIQEAGPSSPCRITGLDELPNADDTFVIVPDLAQAREVSSRRKMRALEQQLQKRAPVTLENLSLNKVTELKVILKADFRGSIEAIRKELEKLKHEEVAVRVLHAGVGGITESDIQLAMASPSDTIVVGFNSVPDDRAHALSDEKGIQVRQYNIIYNLTDDVRNALEGKLKPREEIIHLGRAVVRETFKVSRVGTIAGCFVTQGVIERSAKVRVIRSGVVIYPPPDRSAGLDSLKRFKDDAREVRDGFECGIKIAGYNDIKVDDVIEAFRVEQIQRTLS